MTAWESGNERIMYPPSFHSYFLTDSNYRYCKENIVIEKWDWMGWGGMEWDEMERKRMDNPEKQTKT